ncbi:MAG TPA: hypothetical protein VFM91_08020 [Propionibacteriaceae bacterium]|nr:hypothetical protein [Propionibacteriaceae bacterium]
MIDVPFFELLAPDPQTLAAHPFASRLVGFSMHGAASVGYRYLPAEEEREAHFPLIRAERAQRA